jgi:hypothetical protein
LKVKNLFLRKPKTRKQRRLKEKKEKEPQLRRRQLLVVRMEVRVK